MARLSPEARLLHDITVRFQVYLERLKAGNARGMDTAIRKMDDAVRAALVAVPGAPTRRQLQDTLLNLRRQMQGIVSANNTAYMKHLREFSDYALEFHLATMAAVLPASAPALASVASAAAWAAVLASPIQATGDLLEPFVETWGAAAIRRVEGAIRTGYAQGLTTQQIVQLVRGTKAQGFTDGLLGGVIKRDANAMVRTSLQHVSSSAQQVVYEDNADIVEGYIYIATLDSRTTPQCRSLDLQFFELGKGPVPPIHINCRSTTIPKLHGIDLLSETTRASKGGQVSASQSYYEWLKTQPADFQDDALGPTRGQLFRNGGLSAEEFSRLSLNKNFQPLTLEEMRQKNPSAFKRAGI